jgi:hypothetical protein
LAEAHVRGGEGGRYPPGQSRSRKREASGKNVASRQIFPKLPGHGILHTFKLLNLSMFH